MSVNLTRKEIYPIGKITLNIGQNLAPVSLVPWSSLNAIKEMMVDDENSLLFEKNSFVIKNIDSDFSFKEANLRQINIFIIRNIFEIIYLIAKESIIYKYSSDDTFTIKFILNEEGGDVVSVLISHKFVTDNTSDHNHSETLRLLSEQFLVAKRHKFMLSGGPLKVNSGVLDDTCFFIYPQA
ncbi:MAG: hypothetical protein WCZ15_00675 [Patescibacteria group bacterium]